MIVPNPEELTTASEPVARPDIGSGSISTLGMSEKDVWKAQKRRKKRPLFGFGIERKDGKP